MNKRAMLGKTARTCPWRCCGVWHKQKKEQRRYLKRSERQKIRQEISKTG